MSDESRRAKRRQLAHTVEVVDTMAEETIGRIGNLSISGMLLVSGKPLTEDALYQLRFGLLDRGGRDRNIELGAHQLWTTETSAPGQYWNGLRFIDIAPEDVDFLRLWVEAAGAEGARRN